MIPRTQNPVSSHPDIQALHLYLAGFSSPFVTYNKSHSGSRLLAKALKAQGAFIGSRLNDSEDSVPFVKLIYTIVEEHYPDYQSLWNNPEAVGRIARLAHAAAQEHLARYRPDHHRMWGWKLCESGYALPVLTMLFPGLKAIHLLRDGLDMAFTDHIAPERAFWRKIHFNTSELQSWRGLSLSNRSYRQRPHLFNAVHWANSVNIGRRHGSMMHDRYFELRYECLCHDFRKTMETLLAFLGFDANEEGMEEIQKTIDPASIGKHVHIAVAKKRAVLQLIAPQLLAFGYGGETLKQTRYPPLVARILDRFGWAG